MFNIHDSIFFSFFSRLIFFLVIPFIDLDSYSNVLLTMSSTHLAEKTCIQLPNGEQRYGCPLCQSVKYTQLRQLKSHIKECGSIFKCYICNHHYKQKRSLKLHLKIKHRKHSNVDSIDEHLLTNSL